MIKISQLPDADKNTGGELFPLVQNGVTKKASPLFTDSEMKVHVPENAALVTKVEGTEINLLSAKVVDGVVTVFVGDKEVSLYQDSSLIVTEPAVTDGNAYVRINNKWSIRNSVTQINTKAAPTGGGRIDLIASDVKAHIENDKRDGIAYVSRDGGWIKLADGLQVELDKKADVVHTHAIADVTGLQTALDDKADLVHTHTIDDVTDLQTALDDKADLVHTHAIADVTNLEATLNGKADKVHTHTIAQVTDLQTSLDGKAAKVHTHTIAQVTGLQTKLDGIDTNVSNLETGLNEVKDRLQTAMFYSRDTGFTGTEATGKLPITMKASLKTSVAADVVSFEEDGTYLVQLNTKIDSDGTVVTLKGVPDMIIDGKGHASVSGIFDISTSTKISLEYTGSNSIVDTNLVIHKI